MGAPVGGTGGGAGTNISTAINPHDVVPVLLFVHEKLIVPVLGDVCPAMSSNGFASRKFHRSVPGEAALHATATGLTAWLFPTAASARLPVPAIVSDPLAFPELAELDIGTPNADDVADPVTVIVAESACVVPEIVILTV
jgi:hypothetical protein